VAHHLATHDTINDNYNCVCTQLNIKKLTYVCCENNGNVLLSGSTCIGDYMKQDLIENSTITNNTKKCDLCNRTTQIADICKVRIACGIYAGIKRCCTECLTWLQLNSQQYNILTDCVYCNLPIKGSQADNGYHQKCYEHDTNSECCLDFGKHCDQTFKYIYDCNPNYCSWLVTKLYNGEDWRGTGIRNERKFIKWINK